MLGHGQFGPSRFRNTLGHRRLFQGKAAIIFQARGTEKDTTGIGGVARKRKDINF